MSNPFTETVEASHPLVRGNTAPPQPRVEDPAMIAARQAREAKILEWVAEMREVGHPRQALVAQLAQQSVSEAQANLAINEADLFAGMMGRPHPADIDPNVRERIDQQGPMLVTESLTNQADPVGGDEQNIANVVKEAEQIAAEGADEQTLFSFLTNAGAPPAQAEELTARLIAQYGEPESDKKRFGLRRRK